MRVERYYTHPVMFGRYRAVYDRALQGPLTATGPVQVADLASETANGEMVASASVHSPLHDLDLKL